MQMDLAYKAPGVMEAVLGFTSKAGTEDQRR